MLNSNTIFSVITDSWESVSTHHMIVVGTSGQLLMVKRRLLLIVGQRPVIRIGRVTGIRVRVEFLEKRTTRAVVVAEEIVGQGRWLRRPVRSIVHWMSIWMDVVVVFDKDIADGVVYVCLVVVHL